MGEDTARKGVSKLPRGLRHLVQIARALLLKQHLEVAPGIENAHDANGASVIVNGVEDQVWHPQDCPDSCPNVVPRGSNPWKICQSGDGLIQSAQTFVCSALVVHRNAEPDVE